MTAFGKTIQVLAIAAAIGLAGVSTTSGATFTEGFESFPAGNMSQSTFNASSNRALDMLSTDQVTISGVGMQSGRSVFVRGGAVYGGGELSPTPTVAQFSMVGGIEIVSSSNVVRWDTQGGGMGFGYNNGTSNVSAWNGGSSNVTISLVKTSNGYFTATGPNLDGSDPLPNEPVLFRLGHARNTSNNAGAYTLFGDAAVALEKGHWYQLVGTLSFLGYDEGAGMSSFSTEVALYDLGEEGSESANGPLTAILTGSTTFSYAGDWSNARPIFYAKDDRGFNQLDNLTYVPEPAALSLLGLGGLLALRRRARA